MSLKYEVGTLTTMMTTELNSLASGSGIVQVVGTNAAYDNSNTSNLYFWADFQLAVTFGSAPNADSTVELYLIDAPDGTNYNVTTDGATPAVDLNVYIGSFNLKANTSAQRPRIRGVPLSPTLLKLYAINKSGVSFPSSGSTVKMLPYRTQ